RWLDARVPESVQPGPAEQELVALATRTVTTFDREIQALQFDRALEALWELVKAGNKYVDTAQPWALNKQGDTDRLQTVMRHVLEICFVAGALLVPVMPTKSLELLGRLGANEGDAAAWLRASLERGLVDL